MEKDAFSLALIKTNFSGLELRIVHAALYLRGKKISIDSLRYLLENVKTYRIEKAVEDLVQKGILLKTGINGSPLFLLDVNSEFSEWGVLREIANSGHTNKELYINNNNKNNTLLPKTGTQQIHGTIKKKSPAIMFFDYVKSLNSFTYSASSSMVELGRAKRLYTEALELTHSPEEAQTALMDYFEELYANEWFQGHVKFPIGYALTRFSAWYKSIPPKPRDIRENEELIKRRMKYNFTSRKWEVASVDRG